MPRHVAAECQGVVAACEAEREGGGDARREHYGHVDARHRKGDDQQIGSYEPWRGCGGTHAGHCGGEVGTYEHVGYETHQGGRGDDADVGAEFLVHATPLGAGGRDGGVGDKRQVVAEKAPPITAATYMAVGRFTAPTISAARGARATTVPTEVPTDSDMKHAARNMPGNSSCGGNTRSVSATVASTAPISLAIEAKAPASTKIQIM